MLETSKKQERIDPTSDNLSGAAAGPKAEIGGARSGESDNSSNSEAASDFSDLRGPDRSSWEAQRSVENQATASLMGSPETGAEKSENDIGQSALAEWDKMQDQERQATSSQMNEQQPTDDKQS